MDGFTHDLALLRRRDLLPHAARFAQRGDPAGADGALAGMLLPRGRGARHRAYRAGEVRRVRIEGRRRLRQPLGAGVRHPGPRRHLPREGRPGSHGAPARTHLDARIGRTAHVTVPAGALLRTALRPPGDPHGPRSPGRRRRPLARLPVPGLHHAAAAGRDRGDPRRHPAAAATAHAAGGPQPPRTALGRRREMQQRHRARRDPLDGRLVVVADTLPPRVRPLFERGADLRGPKGCGSAPGTTSRASRPGRSKSTDSGFPATGSRSRGRSCTSSTRRPPAAATRCA